MALTNALKSRPTSAVATIVVARWEGGLDRDALNAALHPADPLVDAPVEMPPPVATATAE